MRKILLLSLSICLILSLTGCGKEVCTQKICVGTDCMEVEVDCETQNSTPTPPPVTTPTPDDNQGLVEDNPTPETPTMTDIPTLVEDPGYSYDNLLDVEQAALNAFQAIIDGDYAGLYDMFYIPDSTFVSMEDVATYFQISNYGAIKGKKPIIISVIAKNQGYSRTVNIKYKMNNNENTNEEVWVMEMMLFNDKWKFVDNGFIGEDWAFKTSTGAIVTLDGIQLTPYNSNRTTDYYKVKTISKVEHKLVYSYKGQEETKYIVPYENSADMIFE